MLLSATALYFRSFCHSFRAVSLGHILLNFCDILTIVHDPMSHSLQFGEVPVTERSSA